MDGAGSGEERRQRTIRSLGSKGRILTIDFILDELEFEFLKHKKFFRFELCKFRCLKRIDSQVEQTAPLLYEFCVRWKGVKVNRWLEIAAAGKGAERLTIAQTCLPAEITTNDRLRRPSGYRRTAVGVVAWLIRCAAPNNSHGKIIIYKRRKCFGQRTTVSLRKNLFLQSSSVNRRCLEDGGPGIALRRRAVLAPN